MKKVRHDAWAALGWQGFLTRIPAEWNPGRLTGDFKTGSLRVDDPEVVRMEMEWREAQGDVTVSGVVDRFVEGLTKEVQRKKGSLVIKRRFDLGDLGKGAAGDDQEVIFWEADCRVHALARRCASSNRIVFVRVIGRLDEDLAGVSREILSGFVDQPPDGPRTWALYDLKCDIPPGFQLETCVLRSGHIQLRFSCGQSALQVDRMSMAGLLLKEISLGAWFEDFYRKDLRDLDRSVTAWVVHGHPGIRAQGRPKSRWRTLLSPLPFLDVRKRTALEGMAWHCAASNKIFTVLHHYKREEDAIAVEEVCRGVVCHKAESPDQPGGDARLPARAQ